MLVSILQANIITRSFQIHVVWNSMCKNNIHHDNHILLVWWAMYVNDSWYGI